MQPLRQLYNDQGLPLQGQGATKDDVLNQGLLHGVSHVWIWRIVGGRPQVLLQKRSAHKLTWPNCYDVSAAGHIDLGEDPLIAAIREAQEEIGLAIAPPDLQCIGVFRAHLRPSPTTFENEFQWLYLLNLPEDQAFSLHESEVEALEWKDVQVFAEETRSESDHYMPHGTLYYDIVIAAIERAVAA